jgi:hypothetical protein
MLRCGAVPLHAPHPTRSPPPPPAWAATTLLAIITTTHHRSFVNNVTDRLAGALSLGAAVHGAVLVASALPSEGDAVREGGGRRGGGGMGEWRSTSKQGVGGGG